MDGIGPDGGKLQVMMRLADSSDVPPGSDIDLFRRGYITVTPLDGRGDTLVAVPGLAEALR